MSVYLQKLTVAATLSFKKLWITLLLILWYFRICEGIECFTNIVYLNVAKKRHSDTTTLIFDNCIINSSLDCLEEWVICLLFPLDDLAIYDLAI